MPNHWTMFADYNAWANARLYAAVRGLPATAFHADGGAFFGSLCGTLNHLLVADRIWMKRLTGEGDAPNRLDAILFAELEPSRMPAPRRIAASRIGSRHGPRRILRAWCGFGA